MRRWIGGILAVVMLLCAGGCGTSTAAAQGDNTTWIAYEEVSDRVKSEENKDIFTYSYQQPVITMQSSAAGVVNNKLDNATTAFFYGSGGVQELTDMARMDWRENWFTCYALERTVSVSRFDENVASFRYTDYAFTGGVHGYTGEYGVTYDMTTGEQLMFSAITPDEWALKESCRQYIRDMVKNGAYEQSEMFFEGYESSMETVLKNWLFTDDGLQFIAQPYVIAPYAVGTIRFTVPYDVIGHLLNEQWIPEKRSVGSGSLAMMEGTAGGASAFTISEGTVPLTVKANGTLYNFSVEEVNSYQYEGAYKFYITEQHLFSPRLENGTTFCLQVPAVETLPNTMLRFETGDGTEHQYYISYNGKSGKYELVTADPQLVRDDG